LFIGESYARGAATDTSNIPAAYPSDSLWHVTADQDFASLFEPCAYHPGGGSGLSPGGAFVWLRYLATGRPQVLVNMGRGGTRTDQWEPIADGGVGWLEEAIDVCNDAIAATGATLRGIVWMQGVNDAIAATTTYAASTDLVVAKCRADLTGGATVPFVFTRLQTTSVTQATQVNWDAVRDLQTAYSGTGVYMVDIPTGTMTSDSLHPQSALNLSIAEGIRDELAPVVP
jgi:hypothetical protein